MFSTDTAHGPSVMWSADTACGQAGFVPLILTSHYRRYKVYAKVQKRPAEPELTCWHWYC
eukprot:953354-Rhodomonas_salina.1